MGTLLRILSSHSFFLLFFKKHKWFFHLNFTKKKGVWGGFIFAFPQGGPFCLWGGKKQPKKNHSFGKPLFFVFQKKKRRAGGKGRDKHRCLHKKNGIYVKKKSATNCSFLWAAPTGAKKQNTIWNPPPHFFGSWHFSKPSKFFFHFKSKPRGGDS